MVFRALLLISVFTAIASVNGNTEGDVLADWKTKLNDPKGLLNSWDTTLVDPCTWFHVTCNDDNSVVRLDLGRAELSGELSTQLAQLTKLQYFAVFNNNLTGVIPPEFGDLTALLSLDLEYNKFSGSIPSSLGNLKSLRFLRLNSNKLTGELPSGIIELKNSGSLQVINVSDNLLTGPISSRRLKGLAIRSNIQDPKRS